MNFRLCRQLSLFLSFSVISEGLLLLPLEEAVVCEGEQLELICSTNVSILQWTSSPLRTDQGRMQTFSRFIASLGESQQNSSFTVNSTSFNVLRVSSQDELPLMSRLTINNVSNDLNGTKVNCTEREMNNEITAVASTIVYVLGERSNSHLEIFTSVEHGTDNNTVTLELIPNTHRSYMYTVSVEPPYTLTSSLSNTQLTVPYNTHINVSIMARLCGQRTTTTVIELHYAKCDYPIANDTQTVHVKGYADPSLEGTTVNFSCPIGQILTGPRTSTCLGNGEWDLDPMESNIRCKVNCGPLLLPLSGYIIFSNATTEGSSISFVCLTSHPESAMVYTAVCNQDGSWEPRPFDTCQLANKAMLDAVSLAVISSLSVFILTAILFFLLGYICGCRQKCRKSDRQISMENISSTYRNTVTTEQVDLTKNEAYSFLNIGSLQS